MFLFIPTLAFQYFLELTTRKTVGNTSRIYLAAQVPGGEAY